MTTATRDRDTHPTTTDYRPAPHWAAVGAAAFTWPLLFVGGLVTTYRVGMAVPDWPTTFGMNMFLYDMREAAFGVFVEHGHRLYGAALGLCTIVLMVDFLAFDRRRSVKALGVLALLAVIGQGVLGGLRVKTNSQALAMVHGCTGQAFFAFMVVLAAITARSWFVARRPVERSGGLRRLAGATLGVAYLQIVLGAQVRHYNRFGEMVGHAGFALVVVGLVAALAWSIYRRRDEAPGLVGPAWAVAATLAFQVILGVAAWALLRPFDGLPHDVDTAQALIRTGHQANAALLLGSTGLIVLRLFGRAAGVPIDEGADARPATAARTLEVVA